MSRLAVCALLVVAACPKKDPSTTQVHPPIAGDARAADAVPAAPAVAPAVRAKQILDGQVAALREESNAIVATFDPDAIVLAPNPRAVKDPRVGLREAIARLSPSASVKDITVDKLVAGGNAGAVWFSAELSIVQDEETALVRVTELATADASWKVVAGAFSETRELKGHPQSPRPLDVTTPAGPLAALLGDPAKLSAALSSDATVFTSMKRAEGAAAKQLVAGFAVSPDHSDKVREVHGKDWGFAMGHGKVKLDNDTDPGHVVGLVIAVPAAGGTWSVVEVHYTGQ